jgi:ABC-type uncharacterized transport system ATPase subunit
MSPNQTEYHAPILELDGITKRFPGILANDQVSLTLRRGEILALLGENGAGKSTLMNIIYGLYHADEGTIRLHGEPTRFASPREAIGAGIGMVHQHFQLIPVLSVGENIALGEEKEFPAEKEQPLIDNAEPRPTWATYVRFFWGGFWRILTPVLAILVGLLIGQIFLQLVLSIGTYLVSGPEFSSFSYDRLPLVIKGQLAFARYYQSHVYITSILIWLPLALAVLSGGGAMFALYRHAKRTWRGGDIHPRSIMDNIIEAVIDLLITITAQLDRRRIGARVRTLSQRYGLEVNPDALVESLPVGIQQRVEIVKALYRKADILILDEPTAVLTPQEAQELFKVMRQLADRGVSIIFITHKLKEVLQVADEIVVMRQGRVVGTVTPEGSTEAKLASLMVGREVLLKVAKTLAQPGQVILNVSHLSAIDDRKVTVLRNVNFEVRAGEILGIAGVQGNGQTELVEVLTGLRKESVGAIEIAGQHFEVFTPRDMTEAGCAHIPEDRQRYGMVSSFSVADNLVLNSYEHAPFAAPPIPQRLPIAVVIFGVIFAAIFLVLGQVWVSTLYPVLETSLNLTDPGLNPRDRPLPFIVALLIAVSVGILISLVAYFVATLIAGRLNVGARAQGGITIDRAAIAANATAKVHEFDIRTSGINVNAGTLSGGNQQKMVVAREFSRSPKLLIASQPTRGIDVGSIEFIHNQIIRQRDAGAAVLLVSAELDEILALSDRIAVMFHGEIIETLPAEAATREQLGLLMAGVQPEAMPMGRPA